jgi:hypothetical protein
MPLPDHRFPVSYCLRRPFMQMFHIECSGTRQIEQGYYMATTPTLIESYERPRRIWPLLVIALTVLFYFRTMVLLQKVPNLSDIRSYYYPLWKFFSGSLRTGSLPFWVPGIYCGFPLYADSEMGLTYPLNMLLLRLPATAGFNYSLIIHYLLGGWFTYAYCRRLRLSRPASVFAAIPFILGGFFISHLVHPNVVATAAWLPLFLYCLERALKERRMSFFIACGGVMGLQFLSGFLMIPLIEAVMGFFYTLFYPRGEGEGFMASLPFRLGGFALALGLGAGVGMIQNLPSYHLVQNSFRSGGLSPSVSNMGSLPPAQLLGLVFPRAFGRGVAMGSYVGAWTFEETYSYIGLLPLLFASMALLRPRRWHTIFFAAVGVLSLLLSLGNHGLLWRLLRLLPGFSVLKGSSRFLLTFNFAAAVLGAMGFDRWRQGLLERKARRALSRFWTIAAAAVGGGILVVTLLYHFNPLDFRDFLAAVFGHLSSGIKQSPHRVLQALQDFFTTPRMEFLVPLLMVVIFLFLLRKAGRGHRPGRGLAAMVIGMAVLDVLIFSSFIYGFVPRAKAEYVPPVVDILSNESAGGRVAMLKEPGVNRGDFPLCPNLLLPEKVNDAFGFSTIPPSRLDRFLALLDQHPDIAAYEQLGVSLLFSNLVRIGGMPYELGTPHYIARGLSAKRYVYPDMVGEQLRLIVDGTVMEPNAYGSLHIILIANSKTGSTPLAVLRLDKESGEDAEVDMVSGEARVFMHRVSFSSPGYGSGRQALEIRLTMKEIINAEELTVATFCEEDLEDTRILALDAVDRRSNALPLTTLSIAYLDRDFVVYRTPEPRPLAYYAWDPAWVESWRKAVDATWQGAAEDGKIYLIRGEVDDQLRSKLNGLEPPGPDAAVTPTSEFRPSASIQSPAEGTTVNLGETITIEFLVTDQVGVTRVDLRRFNIILDSVEVDNQLAFQGSFTYRVDSTGAHQLQIVPWRGDVQGNPAAVTLYGQ